MSQVPSRNLAWVPPQVIYHIPTEVCHMLQISEVVLDGAGRHQICLNIYGTPLWYCNWSSKLNGNGRPKFTEKRKVALTYHQKYLASAFLMRSYFQWYGYLIEDVENSFAKFNGEWPKTLNSSYALPMNWNQDQRFTSISFQDGGVKVINYHMWGEDSDANLHTTAGRRGNKGGSVSKVSGQQCPDIRRFYECGGNDDVAMNFPNRTVDA